jgi:glycosyltransferase involved in cell wall biosynthesis
VEIINFKILTTTEIVFLASLAVIFLIQFFYLLRYLRIANYKDEPSSLPNSDPITIMFSVRNEEEHIREIVDKFNNQDFENYQILIINYCSEDNTSQLLKILSETNPRLKVTRLSEESPFSEKQAINIGLKGASADRIVLLKQESQLPSTWLTQLSSLLSPETVLVFAYTNIERSKGYRNLICRLERFNQFLVSGAWTLAGKPFVFNENNVLFRKSLYFNTIGFRHKLNRNFANLELIFNENVKKEQIRISTNPDLTIREHIEDDRGDHIRLLKKSEQIRQSLSWSRKFGLFTDDFTRILFLALVVTNLIVLPQYWIILSVIPFIYLVLLIIIVKMLLNKLKEQKIFLSSLMYFLIKPLLNWWFWGSMYIIHRRSRWN